MTAGATHLACPTPTSEPNDDFPDLSAALREITQHHSLSREQTIALGHAVVNNIIDNQEVSQSTCASVLINMQKHAIAFHELSPFTYTTQQEQEHIGNDIQSLLEAHALRPSHTVTDASTNTLMLDNRGPKR